MNERTGEASRFYPFIAAGVIVLVLFAAATGFLLGRTGGGVDARDVAADLAKNPDALEPAIGAYLRKHPDVLKDMLAGLLAKGKASDAETVTAPDMTAKIEENRQALFYSSRQVVLGNSEGDVTLVEFFDYNCGFCKRALNDTLALLKSDPGLRIVLKELPILGENSTEAARVAIALRMQNPAGEKYLAFHKKLLGGHDTVDAAHAREAARLAGADMKKLEHDVVGQEVTDTLEENNRLAEVLNISGTPSYVLNHEVLPGAIGVDALRERIRIARN